MYIYSVDTTPLGYGPIPDVGLVARERSSNCCRNSMGRSFLPLFIYYSLGIYPFGAMCLLYKEAKITKLMLFSYPIKVQE